MHPMTKPPGTGSLFPAGIGKHGQEETWLGEIQDIVFHNEENGFTVFRLHSDTENAVITVVGTLSEPQKGGWIRVHGRWEENSRWGAQLVIQKWEYASPTGKEGLVRFLGGGMISGIGPGMAARIVEHFGDSTLEIIDKKPSRLAEVSGIGRSRTKTIQESFAKYRHLSEVFVFLQGYGVGPGTAYRIYNKYKDQSIPVLRNDPYRLAMDVAGIGFLTADRIAQSMGVAADAPRRLEAACLYSLQQAELDGHVFLPGEELEQRTRAFLQCEEFDIAAVAASLMQQRRIRIDDARAYLPFFHHAETRTALNLARMVGEKPRFCAPSDGDLQTLLRNQLDIQLESVQLQAVKAAMENMLTIITGGPGTGKTTLIRAIVVAAKKSGLDISLAAPTGRAARRLAEATGHPAQTLHRLLEFTPKNQKFGRNRSSPLDAKMVVVDEVSMVDLPLMFALTEALAPGCTLCCVGDVDQLPSVGPGQVLRDLIDSGVVRVVRLQKVFRQAQGSMIISCAHEVNEGRFESQGKGTEGDLFFIERDEPETIAGLIRELAVSRIPSSYGMDPMRDIQVLTPMHKGVIGTEMLNTQLQAQLNPAGKPFSAVGKSWRVGDRILQMKNNYDANVFNGDLGIILAHSAPDRQVTIRFDERELLLPQEHLQECSLAYAISIHKSQGSEYPAVIIPLHTQHTVMLQRNLLYTAITRARRLVVIVGSKKAMFMTLRNTRQKERHCRLRERVLEAVSRK